MNRFSHHSLPLIRTQTALWCLSNTGAVQSTSDDTLVSIWELKHGKASSNILLQLPIDWYTDWNLVKKIQTSPINCLWQNNIYGFQIIVTRSISCTELLHKQFVQEYCRNISQNSQNMVHWLQRSPPTGTELFHSSVSLRNKHVKKETNTSI